MKKNELLEKAKNPKNIPGIYNYCDRWCERCRFTSRCLNHALSKEDNLDERDMTNEAFWNKIMETLQTTFELIRDMAEEEGIDLNNIELEEDKEQDNIVHILSPLSKDYADMVDHWLEDNRHLWEPGWEEQNRRTSLRVVNSEPEIEPLPLKDLIEVVRWYQYQIHVKIMRAIHGRKEDEFESDDFPKDSDGSAKVALIGMDRSISAWGELAGCFPEEKQAILKIIESLTRLRHMTEKEFPEGRAFIRPGFDEEPIKSE